MFIARGITILVFRMYVLALASMLTVGADRTVSLRSGTPVFVIFDNSIDREAATEGDTIYLRVLRPVQVDGAVLIRTGEKVRAKVTEEIKRAWELQDRIEQGAQREKEERAKKD